MYLKEYSSYVSGLVRMASSCSDWIGVSYMDAMCFDVNNFKESFCSFYKVKEIKYEESTLSLKELFINIFGDNKSLIEGLCHWLRLEAGECKKVYTMPNDFCEFLDSKRNDRFPFFMLENMFVAEFEKMMICFVIGNDE